MMRALTVAIVFVTFAAAGGCQNSAETGMLTVAVNNETVVDSSDEPMLPPVAEGDWPWWRGPALDGHAAPQSPPIAWSETENVAWKADVPGRGHGTPSVWDSRIFVPTADEAAETKRLLCYDRATGEQLWDTTLHSGGFMHMHKKNSQASATPACDGQRVYMPYMVEHNGEEGIWVTATDLDGNIVWQTNAGPFTTQHGYGSSPLLYKSLVIVAGDNAETGFLTALDRETGEIRWRTERERQFNWATPVVAETSGRTQLLIHGAFLVTSYDPDTGRELWRADGLAQACANTVVFDDSMVYASGGWPEKVLMAIRTDGSGDVSDTHVAWQTEKSIAYVPSMLLDQGRLYAVSDQGIATCYEAASGKVLWQKRLGGNFSASPVLVGNAIYVPDEDGKLHVFRAAEEFESLAVNDLGDGGFASPVIVGGQILLRTNHHLYCLGEPAGG